MAFSVGKCLLKPLRIRAGLTQVQLAEIVGVSAKMISHFENNRRTMSLLLAYIISKAVKCQIEDLYTWDRQGVN